MMNLGIAVACVVAIGLGAGCAKNAPSESHAKTIRAALTRLLERPYGAFTIVEHVPSGKFVQFAGSEDAPLLLDLPLQALSAAELDRAKAVFAAFGHPGPVTLQAEQYPGGPPAGEQTGFMVEFGTDVEAATELAVAVLHRIYGLGEDAKLTLTEE